MPTPSQPTGYRDLAAWLRAQIQDGTLPPGARLPSERDLQQQFGLARDTVRAAVERLRWEGRVVVRHGQATRVADHGDKIDVTVEVGSTVEARMPTPEEQDAHGIPDGVPVLHVIEPGGSAGDIYPAHTVRLRLAKKSASTGEAKP